MLAVFSVDSTADTGPGTLREAIDLANAAEGPDEIVFDQAVYSTPQVIAIDSALPTVTEGLTLTGPGRDLLAIDGQHGFDGLPGTGSGWPALEIERPHNAGPFTLAISGLTIQHFEALPGAIESAEALSLENVALRENLAGLSVRNDLTIRGSAIADHYGGAVRHSRGSLIVSDSEFVRNVGASAVESIDSGMVTIDRSYFHGNVADRNGGALYVSGADTLSITNSTLANNQAGADGYGRGGGIYVVGTVAGDVRNVTLSENRADNAAAIFAVTGSFHLGHSTIVDSVVGSTSDFAVQALNVTIDHTIIARTVTPSAEAGGIHLGTMAYDYDVGFDHFSDAVITNSLLGRVEGGLPDKQDGNRVGGTGPQFLLPRLGPLAMNGGPTPTHAPLPGSLALDAGDPAYAAAPSETDQRGEPYVRVVGDAIDIGAYESQGVVTRAPGDFNGDGRFDAADYTVWRDSYGSMVAPLTEGDADGDGAVNDSDLASWSARYGDRYFAGTELIVNDPGTVNDQDIHNGQTTLREAIEYLNANPGLSVVRFAPSMNGQTIDFTDCGPGFGCPGSGGGPFAHVEVTTEMTIDASDLPDGVTVKSGRPLFWVGGRPLDENYAFEFTLRSLTIDGGETGGLIQSESLGRVTLDRVTANLSAEQGRVFPNSQRGVFSRGPIDIIDSVIDGGGLYRTTFFAPSVGSVTSWQDLTLIRSEIRGGHGGVSAVAEYYGNNPWLPTVTLIDSVVADTFGRPAIYAEGNVELVRSRVENGAAGGIVANSMLLDDLEDQTTERVGGNVVLIDSSVTGSGPIPGGYLNTLNREPGAGIAAYGDVSLLRSRVENNDAGFDTDSRGGGILAGGSVYAEDAHISGNTAKRGGGIYVLDGLYISDDDPGELDIAHPVTLVRTTLDGNRARLGGAAVHSHGTIRLEETTVTGNEVGSEFYWNEYEAIVLLEDDEATSRIDIFDSTLANNTATYPTSTATVSATWLSPVEITRTGISDNVTYGVNATRVVDSQIVGNAGVGIRAHAAVSVEGTTVMQNGGGVEGEDVVITNSDIIDNVTYTGFAGQFSSGGGVHGGRVELRNTRVTGNRYDVADLPSGGLSAGVTAGLLIAVDSTIANNTLTDSRSETPASDPIQGGGVLVSSLAQLYRTTVSGNAAIGPGARGGGIQSERTVELHNSTVSGNRVEGPGAVGGGIDATNLFATHSTIAHNAAVGGATGGGGLIVRNDLGLRGVVISENTADTTPDLGGDLAGTITIDHSLIGDTTGSVIDATTGVGNLLDVDPMLGPLTDNGGPTLTHALLISSPAINAGDPTRTAVPFSYIDFDGQAVTYDGFIDQRGEPFTRVADGGSGTARIDIGAYELQSPTVPAGKALHVANSDAETANATADDEKSTEPGSLLDLTLLLIDTTFARAEEGPADADPSGDPRDEAREAAIDEVIATL